MFGSATFWGNESICLMVFFLGGVGVGQWAMGGSDTRKVVSTSCPLLITSTNNLDPDQA